MALIWWMMSFTAAAWVLGLATPVLAATVMPIELPIELMGSVTVSPAPGEPPFPTHVATHGGSERKGRVGGGGAVGGGGDSQPITSNQVVVICVLDRHGSFTLGKPGYAQGNNGNDGRWVTGTVSADGKSVRCPVPSATTAGNTTVGLAFVASGVDKTSGIDATQATGPFPPADPRWALASLRHFAVFQPAFSRRPYVRESMGAVVAEVDTSLAGQKLVVNISLPNGVVSRQVVGPRTGVRIKYANNHATPSRVCRNNHCRRDYSCLLYITLRPRTNMHSPLPIPPSQLPHLTTLIITIMMRWLRAHRVDFSLADLPPTMWTMVNISLTLPDGTIVAHPRVLARASPERVPLGTTVFQVDHESASLLRDGIPFVANGWFAGGYDGESAGTPPALRRRGLLLPLPQARAGNASYDEEKTHSALEQASMVTEWGRQGVTFIRLVNAILFCVVARLQHDVLTHT